MSAKSTTASVTVDERDGGQADYIEVKNIAVTYSSDPHARPILDDFSYRIRRGAFVTIVGGSGCGKTTLLKALSGLVDVNAGQIVIDGEQLTKPRSDVIYVFQDYSKSVLPWLRVEDNVLFGIRHRTKIPRARRRELADRYLEMVGLSGENRKFPRQLSGGMQQRVAIARALACQPSVILMDEPFSAVDALTRDSLQNLMQDIYLKEGLTVVFVTHDIEESVTLGSDILVLGHGGVKNAELENPMSFPRDKKELIRSPQVASLRQVIYDAIMTGQDTLQRGPVR